MDRVTFDFETGEIIFDTDYQQGTEIDLDLKSKRAAIMQAAGFDTVTGAEIVDDFKKALEAAGYSAEHIQ